MSKARYIISSGKIKVTADLKGELLVYFNLEKNFSLDGNEEDFLVSMITPLSQEGIDLSAMIIGMARAKSGDIDKQLQDQIDIVNYLELIGDADEA